MNLLHGTWLSNMHITYTEISKGIILNQTKITHFHCDLPTIIIIIIITAIGLSPGGSGYFTCIQNMKLVTNKFKSGGLHKKHVVATWNLGNHLSICL